MGEKHLCGGDDVSNIQVRKLSVALDDIAKGAVTTVHEVAARCDELRIEEKEKPL